MVGTPLISVVISIFDEADYIQETLEGLAAQEDVECEIIVVDDGSNDDGARIVERISRTNTAIKLVQQPNAGLSRALLRGCREAKGQYIARHDARDRSASTRLKEQLEVLSRQPDVAMVSSWVRYIGPGGEPAGGVRHDPKKADDELAISSGKQTRVRGPYHGSAMFRSADYEAVGGYRPEFYFAQDVDLWLRLHELGRHHIIPEELYTARLDAESITGRYRAEQDRCLELAVEAARARRAGRSEAPYLTEASRIRPSRERVESLAEARRRRARALYSLGCMLAAESPAAAARYFRRSLGADPFQPKAWLRFVASLSRSGAEGTRRT